MRPNRSTGCGATTAGRAAASSGGRPATATAAPRRHVPGMRQSMSREGIQRLHPWSGPGRSGRCVLATSSARRSPISRAAWTTTSRRPHPTCCLHAMTNRQRSLASGLAAVHGAILRSQTAGGGTQSIYFAAPVSKRFLWHRSMPTAVVPRRSPLPRLHLTVQPPSMSAPGAPAHLVAAGPDGWPLAGSGSGVGTGYGGGAVS